MGKGPFFLLARKFLMKFRELLSKRRKHRDFAQPKKAFFLIVTFKDISLKFYNILGFLKCIFDCF